MNRNFQRRVKQLYPKKPRNARKRWGFACPATPDPTPPGSVMMTRKAVVGSGLLDRLNPKGAGAETKDKRFKDTDKAKVKVNGNGKTNTVENPPINLLVMKQVLGAGFSTPFPEGGAGGPFYLNFSISGGGI